MSRRIFLTMPGDAEPQPCDIWQGVSPTALSYLIDAPDEALKGLPEPNREESPRRSIAQLNVVDVLTRPKRELLESEGPSGRDVIAVVEAFLSPESGEADDEHSDEVDHA